MPVIVSKANQQLVVPGTPQARALLPSARPLPYGNGAEVLVVPHRIPETLLVRHMGYKAPSPMLSYYDWKGGRPFAIQRQTCALLSENARAYVLNDMGTGKTKCPLWTWDYLNEQGLARKMLVVAPLSTLNFVWAREIFATLPHRKVSVLHGPKATRLAKLAQDADIYVINHDGLKVIAAELEARDDIDTLCLDELAVYRNESARSKHMRKFAARFKIVWGMSGAPMPNEPPDVWAQCKIITPHTVPKYRRHAVDMLMTRITQFKFAPKPDAVERAFTWMQPSVRYSLDDVMELPPVITRDVDVALSPQQTKMYKSMADQCHAMIQNKEINAMNAGVAMGKLLQIAGGWVYTKAPEYAALDATPRTDALLDLIESTERKVLVFAPYRHALAELSKLFTQHGIDHCTIHGQTKDRDDLFNRFQNTTQFKLLNAHPECLAHGLTLTVADTVIWYLPMASLDIYDQANHRITRVGQKHKQQILHMQATPIERKLYSMLRSKQKMQNQLLTLLEEATSQRIMQ